MDPNTQAPQPVAPQPVAPQPAPIQPTPTPNPQPFTMNTPADQNPPKKSNTLVFLLLLLILLAVLGMGGMMYLNAQKTAREAVVPTPTPQVTDLTPSPVGDITPTASASPITILIESQGTLPTADVAEIQARVIDPFMDYFKEARLDDSLVSVTVTKNTQANSTTYPYVFDSLSKNGVKQGALISKTNGHLDWWLPECLNGCNLSTAFETKYPEIANQVQ